jgi:hypothetical protein
MSKRRDLSDMRTGRLTVLRDSGNRTKKGEIVWLCMCDCGALHHASTGNLVNGSVRSCGCLARELASMRCRAAARPPKACRYPGCGQSTEKGGHGYCGMHAQRVRRYGDPDYVTSADVLRANNRASQIKRFPRVKPTTYRKFFGRHEHRVVAETLVGRPLRPDEHVHHKDENKHNNSPENLVVLHPSEHAALHALQRKLEKC